MIDLFFDLETIPDQRPGALEKCVAEVKPPGQYKKPSSIECWLAEHAPAAALEAWKRTALTGIAGEICSIAWAFDDEKVEGFISAEEDAVINQFFRAISHKIKPGEGKYPQIQWIGHNIIEFDLRFLFQRCVIRDIEPPVRLPLDKRHGQGVYDTMKAWAGWKGYVKQDAIVDVLEEVLPGTNEALDMDGSKVWDMYQAGQFETILEYNKLDVKKVRRMYQRMNWHA